MKNSFIIICLLLAVPLRVQPQSVPADKAADKIRTYVEMAATGEVLRDAQFGVLAMTVGGDTLVSWQSNRLFIPASNMKLVTTGVALHELGPAYRFETQLAAAGRVVDGVLQGDLYIVGHGDPTVGATDPEDMPLGTLFGKWEKIISEAGIRRIEGRIVGDGRWFDGPVEQDTWMYQDLGAYYGAGGDALGFYRNIVDVEVRAGGGPGSMVEVRPSYPKLPWMHYTSAARTTAKGTGNQLVMFNTDLAPVAELRGTLAADIGPHKQECSNLSIQYAAPAKVAED